MPFKYTDEIVLIGKLFIFNSESAISEPAISEPGSTISELEPAISGLE